MTSIEEWDEEYAKLARVSSQLRASNQQHSMSQTTESIRSGLQRLHSSLNSMPIDPSDAARRRNLVENLSKQVDSPNGNGDADLLGMSNSNFNSNSGNGHGLSSGTVTAQALRHQDELIDELANGVSRLKNQTIMINDETQKQNRMVDNMECDVDTARMGLEAETLRAVKLKEDKSVWRLYLLIAGLSFLLFILVLTGLG